MKKTYGPYSPSTTVDQLVFTAGQVGATSGSAPADIVAQTKLALTNLEAVLADAGSSLEQVVKVTVFLINMDHFAAMNQIYAQVFKAANAQPARSTVALQELPRVADQPLLIEVEAIAYRNVT